MTLEKPCRTCTDFRTWAKLQKKSYESEKIEHHKDDATHDNKRANCPLDKDELGSATWSCLHTMAAYFPEKPTKQQSDDMRTFFNVFSKFYPCAPCAEDLREQLKKTPPQTESQEELSQWLCRLHNEVNKKLDKPLFDCKLVNQRWKDGWLDGSCD